MTGGGGSQPQQTSSAASTPQGSPEESPTPLAGEVVESSSPETVSVGACIPGTWSARMPELVAGLPVPGGAEYLDGSYTFTFEADNSYTAEYADVSFRMGTQAEFVDVYNSWSESGSWIGGVTAEEWDAALVNLDLDTSRLKLSTLDMTDGLLSAFQVEDPRSMVLIAGSNFQMNEAYGMVQGQVRTPPLSDEGSAIVAIGYVDCDSGVLQVDTLLPNWAPMVTLDRVE